MRIDTDPAGFDGGGELHRPTGLSRKRETGRAIARTTGPARRLLPVGALALVAIADLWVVGAWKRRLAHRDSRGQGRN